MGSWRSFRKTKKLIAIVLPAAAAAQQNPIPANIDELGSIYVGDMVALSHVAQTVLYGGNESWLKDPSDYGRRLRDIARVIYEWVNKSDETNDRSSKELLYARIQRDRWTLTVIAWLLEGKSIEEIQRLDGQ